ncbi:MAG: GNAT family N-acetyltransferase [Clostridia bacterium]|nr:GNAT family N-acetyltransferase [Clostridia bacterium]
MNNEYTFEILSNRSDYREVIELIYQTDPYIYKDLFGNIENAHRVLYRSFENPKCVFYKKAIYIVRAKEQVIGVALYHANDFHWDPNALLEDFEKAELQPPESFSSVSAYMDKTYNYCKLGNSMCNVSVRSDYQRKGVASFLLASLLDISTNEIVELTVLSDNIAAIKLYEKFGFKIVGEAFKDYGGHLLPPVDCYKMVLNRRGFGLN